MVVSRTLELIIKHSRACECVCLDFFLGGGGSEGNTTVTASCVYVFNVKCTLFLG